MQLVILLRTVNIYYKTKKKKTSSDHTKNLLIIIAIKISVFKVRDLFLFPNQKYVFNTF